MPPISRTLSVLPLLCLCLTGAENPQPVVVHTGPVAPDILAIEIQAGRLRPIRQVPYEKQPGDEVQQQVNQKTGEPRWVRLVRDGKPVGFLVGRERRVLSLYQTLEGKPLDTAAADKPESYVIRSSGDSRFARGLAPAAVWRKTKTNDWADSGALYTSRHYIYLKLPFPLKAGAAYSIALRLNTSPGSLTYRHEPASIRSEAVHVTHIGFRPEDPGKSAFLSIWMGTGGGHEYPAGLRFFLRDERNGKRVYEGAVKEAWKADAPEQYGRKINFEKTSVYRMDFGEFRTPGTYRVCVAATGCSYPFPIADDVWLKAYRVSMKGHYHHRSGIELGPPYTDYRRPRPFHPADGTVVYQSTCSLTYSGNGLNLLGTERNNFDCLVSGKTSQVVQDAWGGYMDAGDWDRRIQHLEATRLHFELMELFPGFFGKVGLTIPESGKGLPDTVAEALFNLDHYRRLQAQEGGIRGGVESSEHPVAAETSWQESQTVLTYSPGLWESHIYAGIAARAAWVLGRIGAADSAAYRESALRAMRWAEQEYSKWKSGPDFARSRASAKAEIETERSLAAVELFRLTGDTAWHDLFLSTTPLAAPDPADHRRALDAAFVYARLEPSKTDPRIREAALAAIEEEAGRAIRFAEGNAFRISLAGNSPHPYSGFYTVPASIALVRAHALTGKAAYLEAIVRSAQFSAGANPMNMTMTIGVGHDYPRNPLHEDSRHSGQPAPAGITVYGPIDLGAAQKEFPLPRLQKECTPPALEWPVAESYFDIYVWPPVNEYTMMQTLGPSSYVWGYLAARGR